MTNAKTERVDAVVIGTGFGGSVAAARLAERGLSVVVLERGKLYPPGSFPRSPHMMARNWWDPSEGLFGLYEAWSFRTLGALVSSGVGGGSLIYANVLLRKDEKWFVSNGPDGEDWPVSRQDLEPHYDRVQAEMKPQKYPFDVAPYSRTPKTHAMKEAAEALHLNWTLPDLAVTFANEGRPPIPGEPIVEALPNLHGRARLTCRLCGECDVGCNEGAKNTTDYTFLSAATRNGADLRPLCEVRELAPLQGGGCRVSYVRHDSDGLGPEEHRQSLASLETLEAPIVVLAAGTLGSTYLLLRSRPNFPGLSEALGTRFSGNGDLLAFGVRCKESVGGSLRPRLIDPTYGPVITSTIRLPDALDENGGSKRGAYIQDGGQPNFASWVAEGANLPGVGLRLFTFALRYFGRLLRINHNTSLSRDLSIALGSGMLTASTMTMLGMGRDVAGGRMSLDRDRLAVDWPKKSSGVYFRDLTDTMKAIVHHLGGRYVPNPVGLFGRTITVHPLGGCPMGRDASRGVVDSYGRVFGYPGLIVADGSVMPGPVGANPSLTIAALADRFVGHAAENTRARGQTGEFVH